MSQIFDVVVLGGGSGGYATALRAAQLGLSVGLIERDKLGGTCLHRGCIPTKAILHAAETADATSEAEQIGVLASFTGIDMPKLHLYKDGVVDRLHQGLAGLIKTAGITVISGEGRLVGPSTVDVEGSLIIGGHVVLATGSVVRTLPGVALSARVITSEGALRLDHVPKRVAVIGGSVIGVEFASAWRSFGAEVTVIEALPSLVPLEDPALVRHLSRAFRKRGITALTGTRVAGVVESADEVTVSLENGQSVGADVVLVAIGRGPASAGLGLEKVGVGLDRGWVTTDERLRTNIPGVYAVGDLVAGLQLAHRGFAHGIFVAEQIAGLNPDPIEDSAIPRVTYCEPELASVGLTEPQARDRFGDVQVVEYSLGGNGRSQILQTSGLVKVVREKDGPIVGVHLAGARMGEQIGEATLMVGWEAFPEDVARFIHAHPTQNEALGEAALVLAGKPLHAHA